jgi:hypothetical protein
VFPLEVRAKAIAVFFVIAQCFGSLGAGQIKDRGLLPPLSGR